MVKRWITALFVASVSTAGCAAYATSPATGWIFTNVSAPVTATAYPTGSKTGTSTCTSILGLFASGDCSIGAAMKNGGITRVQYVDYRTTGMLGLYATHTIIVHGEP